MYKAIIWSSSLALLALIYHFEAIAGRWRFDHLCQREGGSEFVLAHDSPQENRVWEVVGSDPSAYQALLDSGFVAFVRFQDGGGMQLDAHPDSAVHKRYVVVPADSSKPADYRLSVERNVLVDDLHISQVRYAMTDVANGHMLAKHTSFAYVWGPSDRLLLSPAPSAACHEKTDLKAFVAAAFHRGQVLAQSRP
jgi:hypothetical protein